MSVHKATSELKGKGVAYKNELLFSRGINYDKLPSWQKRGVGLWMEEYEKEGLNPLTGESKVATLREICEYVGCQMVPVEEEGDDLLAKYPDEAALLARAEGIGYNGTTREGIVIRPVTPVHSNILSGPLSMKVINNKYLMKNDE